MRTKIYILCLLIVACNSATKKSDTISNKKTKNIVSDSCDCKDSFYAAVIDSSIIRHSIKNGHQRLRFDFYENKNSCVDSFKIEGWYQKGANDTSISINLLQYTRVAAQSFSMPYHFRDLQLAVRNKYGRSILALLNSVGINTQTEIDNCNFEIVLKPYDSSNIIIIKAQLFYSCFRDTKILTAGPTVNLNPCPPNKPQGN